MGAIPVPFDNEVPTTDVNKVTFEPFWTQSCWSDISLLPVTAVTLRCFCRFCKLQIVNEFCPWLGF